MLLLPHPSTVPHCAPPPVLTLQTVQDTLRQQQEQEASLGNEQEGYQRQLGQERQRNEQSGEVIQKLEAQAERLGTQIERVQLRQAELKVGGGCRVAAGG